MLKGRVGLKEYEEVFKIHIAICDDELQVYNDLKQYIGELKENRKFEIDKFQSGKAFVEELKEKYYAMIFFRRYDEGFKRNRFRPENPGRDAQRCQSDYLYIRLQRICTGPLPVSAFSFFKETH